MHIMGDALTVLGARLGIGIDPYNRRSYLVRHGKHPGIPIQIHAGVELGERTIIFPLAEEGEVFEFLDQGSTPTSMVLSGIDPESGLHLKLIFRIPFRPRDIDFSVVPAVFIEMEVARLGTPFRWRTQKSELIEGKAFLAFSGEGFSFSTYSNDITASYISEVSNPLGKPTDFIECKDRLAVLSGTNINNRIECKFSIMPGDKPVTVSAAWCSYDEPVLNVLGDKCRFKYTELFGSIDEVADWARKNAGLVKQNSKNVDGIILGHNLGESISHLMAFSLHAWLMDTWMVVRPDGKPWFTVWEGGFYFHSTIDVEYTQAPMYLTLWPELLGMQLDEWPLFGKDGSLCLGERGKDTLYLSHDMGEFSDCSGQLYPHDRT